MIRAAGSGRISRGRTRLVAGLTPTAPTTDPEYREALAERAHLIQQAAHADLRHAYTQHAAWPPTQAACPPNRTPPGPC